MQRRRVDGRFPPGRRVVEGLEAASQLFYSRRVVASNDASSVLIQ